MKSLILLIHSDIKDLLKYGFDKKQVTKYFRECHSWHLHDQRLPLVIGSQTIVVRRANTMFAPTLISNIGLVSVFV